MPLSELRQAASANNEARGRDAIMDVLAMPTVISWHWERFFQPGRRASLTSLSMLICAVFFAAGCPKYTPPKASRELPAHGVETLVRSDVVDKAGWAGAVRLALLQAGERVTVDTACQVFAIIEQESGYEVDPAVPGLGDVVKGEVDAVFAKLGPAAAPARKALLDHAASGGRGTFDARLGEVRTERQADQLYREIVAFHMDRHPHIARAMRLLAPDFVEDHNPITTAGSMQVAVSWAIAESEDAEPTVVRDQLYTQAGGVQYGTARLFVHDAGYADPRFRFADFNAGVWASRNAAIQAQVSNLTGRDLVLDGDFLRYDSDGTPSAKVSNTVLTLLVFRDEFAPQLTDRQVRRDAAQEKTAAFDQTETVRLVRSTWEAKHGQQAASAWMPMVSLHSPKMKAGRTTAWFAKNVGRRYDACVARGGGVGSQEP